MPDSFDFIVKLRDKFSTAVAGLRKNVAGVITQLGRLTGISAAITAAFGAISGLSLFRRAVSEAGEFERSLDSAQAVLSATAEEMARVQDRASQLASTTSFNSSQVAAGIEELGRAGLSAGQAIEAIGPVLSLARSNNLDLAQAATIASTSLNQFGLEAEETGRIADVFTKAAASSATNVEQLAGAFGQLGPGAKDAGLSVEQTAAIIGELANVGIRGEKAGTALRNILAQLQDPASKASKALQGLGITSTNFVDILAELEVQGSKANVAIQAFGLEALPAINALVQGGSASLVALTGELERSGGAAAAAAEQIKGNFFGALDDLGNLLQALRERLGQPVLEPLTAQINTFVERIREFIASADFERLAQSIAKAVTDAARVIGEFIASIDFRALSQQIAEFVTNAQRGFDSFSEKARSVSTVVSVAFDGVKSSILVVMIAFEQLVGVAALAAQKVAEAARSILDNAPFGALKDQVDQLTTVIDGFAGVAEGAYERSAQKAGVLADTWTNRTTPALQAGTDAMETLGTSAETNARKLTIFEKAAEVLGKAVGNPVAAFKAGADAISDLADQAVEATAEQEELAKSSENVAARLQAFKQAVSDLEAAGLGASTQANNLRIEVSFLERQLRQTESATKGTIDAFQVLGIQSQAALENVADTSKTAFDQLVADFERGDASREDVVRGFEAYGRALLATADQSDEQSRRVIENQLKQEAAAAGVESALELLGIAGEDAGEKVAEGANKGKVALDDQADAARGAAGALDEVGRAAGRSAQASERLAAGSNSAGAALGLSGEQARLYGLALAQGADQARAFLREVERNNEQLRQAYEAGVLTNQQVQEAKDRNLEAAKAIALYNNQLGPLADGLSNVNQQYQQLGKTLNNNLPSLPGNSSFGGAEVAIQNNVQIEVTGGVVVGNLQELAEQIIQELERRQKLTA